MILLQRGSEGSSSFLVVSIETSFPLPLDHSAFEDYARDREGELAIFALKAKHDLRLTLREGYVKARLEPQWFRFFPGRFDPNKWRNVLEQILALVRSLERHGA